MQQRRKYSQEFKQEAVHLATEPGVSIRQVAHELGINDSVLRRWCKEQRDFGNKAFHGQVRASHAMKRWLPSSVSWPESRRNGIF